ncbi:MAG: hypothetical protein C4519_01220 [Desulfobacteraceae bacterium]|nr:MAG: hypothetical protein C4519_01220 [Desulfobacteraceae bacterium]
MPWLSSLFENLLVVILTIIVLAGGIYMLLVILQYGLKLKSGGREEERLTTLWQENLNKRPLDRKVDHSDH